MSDLGLNINANQINKLKDALKNIKSEELDVSQFTGNVDNIFAQLNTQYDNAFNDTGMDSILKNIAGEDDAISEEEIKKFMETDGDTAFSAKDFETFVSNAIEDALTEEDIIPTSASNWIEADMGLGSTAANFSTVDTNDPNLKRIVDEDGNVVITVRKTYDEDGNLVKKLYNYSDNPTLNSKKYEYTYDEEGNLIGQKNSISKNDSYTTFKYNDEGKLIEQDYDNKKDNTKDFTKTIEYKGGSTVTTTETIGKTTETKNYGESSTTKITNLKYNSNGIIEDTKQSQVTGDCWVLAAVNSLNATEKGKEILQNSIQHNKDGSITVKLNGVEKEYTYSAEEIVELSTGKYTSYKYASGDLDVNLIEFAIEDYRDELIRKGEAKLAEDATSSLTSNSPTVAIEYLTGKKSDHHNDEGKNYGEDRYASDETMQDVLNEVKTNGIGNNLITLCFNYEETDIKMPNGKNAITKNHAYSLVNVDDENVYLINPWDSSEIITYPLEKFNKNVHQLYQTVLD